MLSMKRARRRAARGAFWLDQVKLGWAKTVDVSVLNQYDDAHCVIAQILGNGDYENASIGRGHWATWRGFVSFKDQRHVLNAAWREEIDSRINPVHDR